MDTVTITKFEPVPIPSYYGIIIAAVRYDKDLSPNSKLLYADITALTNLEGFCWASNSYFAKLYGVHKNTVSSWINELARKGFIVVEQKDDYRRLIRLSNTFAIQEKLNPPSGKAEPPSTKSLTPLNENVDTPQRKAEDNTILNNISNNINNISVLKHNNQFIKPSLEEVKSYCKERNNLVDSDKFFNYYESNGWKVGRNLMKNWKAAIHTWEKSSYDKKPVVRDFETERKLAMIKKFHEEDIANGII